MVECSKEELKQKIVALKKKKKDAEEMYKSQCFQDENLKNFMNPLSCFLKND